MGNCCTAGGDIPNVGAQEKDVTKRLLPQPKPIGDSSVSSTQVSHEYNPDTKLISSTLDGLIAYKEATKQIFNDALKQRQIACIIGIEILSTTKTTTKNTRNKNNNDKTLFENIENTIISECNTITSENIDNVDGIACIPFNLQRNDLNEFAILFYNGHKQGQAFKFCVKLKEKLEKNTNYNSDTTTTTGEAPSQVFIGATYWNKNDKTSNDWRKRVLKYLLNSKNKDLSNNGIFDDEMHNKMNSKIEEKIDTRSSGGSGSENSNNNSDWSVFYDFECLVPDSNNFLNDKNDISIILNMARNDLISKLYLKNSQYVNNIENELDLLFESQFNVSQYVICNKKEIEIEQVETVLQRLEWNDYFVSIDKVNTENHQGVLSQLSDICNNKQSEKSKIIYVTSNHNFAQKEIEKEKEKDKENGISVIFVENHSKLSLFKSQIAEKVNDLINNTLDSEYQVLSKERKDVRKEIIEILKTIDNKCNIVLYDSENENENEHEIEAESISKTNDINETLAASTAVVCCYIECFFFFFFF